MNRNSDGVDDRLVLYFPGFEPVSSKLHYLRFNRECGQFQKLWGVQQEIGPLNEAEGASYWQTETHGNGWSNSTRMVLMEWCSLLNHRDKPAFWRQVFASAPPYFSHFATLAPWRYFKTNWRYGLTFIYPVLTLLLAAALSLATMLVAVWVTAQLFGNPPVILFLLIGLVLFFVIFRFLGQRWALPVLLEYFHHAYCISFRGNETFKSRISVFSAILSREIEAGTADEINITTYSMGSVYAVSSLANAIRNKPDLLNGKMLYFTSIASSLLHNALMARCQWLRDDLKLVLEHSNIQWIEIYATNDPICFGKCSPESVIDGKAANAVVSRRVRFSRMVDKKRYRLMRYNFFQLHLQMVKANHHRYFYDFYLLLFGPRNVVDLLQRKADSEI